LQRSAGEPAISDRIGRRGVICDPRDVDRNRRSIAVCAPDGADLSALPMREGWADRSAALRSCALAGCRIPRGCRRAFWTPRAFGVAGSWGRRWVSGPSCPVAGVGCCRGGRSAGRSVPAPRRSGRDGSAGCPRSGLGSLDHAVGPGGHRWGRAVLDAKRGAERAVGRQEAPPARRHRDDLLRRGRRRLPVQGDPHETAAPQPHAVDLAMNRAERRGSMWSSGMEQLVRVPNVRTSHRILHNAGHDGTASDSAPALRDVPSWCTRQHRARPDASCPWGLRAPRVGKGPRITGLRA